MRTYYVTADCDDSVAHCCSVGAVEDPAQEWDMRVEAADEDEAIELARPKFEEFVERRRAEYEANCPKCRCPGDSRWWGRTTLSAVAEGERRRMISRRPGA